jgi:hypothetical protein
MTNTVGDLPCCHASICVGFMLQLGLHVCRMHKAVPSSLGPIRQAVAWHASTQLYSAPVPVPGSTCERYGLQGMIIIIRFHL